MQRSSWARRILSRHVASHAGRNTRIAADPCRSESYCCAPRPGPASSASHAAALRDTARQTEALVGWAFGGGLFVNYFFLALWAFEAGWWWLAPASYRGRRRRFDQGVCAFFLLMFLNGAVVFAHGPLRLLGAAAVLLVAWSWYRRAGAEGDSG